SLGGDAELLFETVVSAIAPGGEPFPERYVTEVANAEILSVIKPFDFSVVSNSFTGEAISAAYLFDIEQADTAVRGIQSILDFYGEDRRLTTADILGPDIHDTQLNYLRICAYNDADSRRDVRILSLGFDCP
ncbi:MAG: hypothetical protein AAF531_14945, partial [Actinomycetota bacterium]